VKPGKLGLAISSVLLAAFTAAGCDRPATQGTAAINTGNSASPSPSRLEPSTPGSPTGDTASPNASATASSQPVPGKLSGGAMAETATTGKIKAALAADSGLRDSDISVSTQDGVVTLDGSVKSQEQAAIAMQLAQRQEGVARVENKLSVR
jgi:hyperosmotically inducible periplasmic protein